MKRTIRPLAAALSIAAMAMGIGASPVAASGETIGSCVFEEVLDAEQTYGSLHALEEGPEADLEKFEDDLEGCLEAPSPILPALDEVIWGTLAFIVLLVFMKWKGFPLVKGAMDARADKIRADLDAADKAKAEALRTQSEYGAALAEAKSTASRIIDEARDQASQLERDLRARAEAEIDEQRARAAAEISTARSQAIEDLRSEVSVIAIGAAERVVGVGLDNDRHRRLIDRYIDEVAGIDG